MASSDLKTPSRAFSVVLGVIAVLVIAVGVLFASGTVEFQRNTARAPMDPAETTRSADEPRTPAMPMRPAAVPPDTAPAPATPPPDRPAQQ
jgi:hypothetical protein